MPNAALGCRLGLASTVHVSLPNAAENEKCQPLTPRPKLLTPKNIPVPPSSTLKIWR